MYHMTKKTVLPLLTLTLALPNLSIAETPYNCFSSPISYEVGVELQTSIVALFADAGTDGINLNNEASTCVAVTVDSHAALVCINDSLVAVTENVTAAEVQSAFGQLLSDCVSLGEEGLIIIDGIRYEML